MHAKYISRYFSAEVVCHVCALIDVEDEREAVGGASEGGHVVSADVLLDLGHVEGEAVAVRGVVALPKVSTVGKKVSNKT